MKLKHFGHRYPLTLSYQHKNDDGVFWCNGCGRAVFGFYYSCNSCNCFVLHKACAQQPRELQHPLHPKHPLILLEGVPADAWTESTCYCCKECLIGYTYHCSHCNFNLHLDCASLSVTIETEIHDHPLTLLRKSISFTCDACTREGNGLSYLCAACHFMVHPECGAPLPLTVKHLRREHPLNLTSSLQVNQSHLRICQLCVKEVDSYRVYYCSICDFVAHPDCATYKEDMDETFECSEFKDKVFIERIRVLRNENSRFDESVASLTYVANEINLIEDKVEIGMEIKHFSHEHGLKLTDELLNKEKCDGCTQPIFPPFYSCPQCPFFLHESCIKLPREKRHLLHRHPLTLLPKASYGVSLFRCNACNRLCNGFTYNCDTCGFDLDVQCSLISNKFTHDGHEHQLIFSSAPCNEKCSCCDSNSKGKVFKCADCEFTLDVICATLPRTVRYRSYEQPFKLCYSVEDNSGEYYCDICEEKRDPKDWFYYCTDLRFPAHPGCILGLFPNIKFGRSTFTSRNLHRHPLTLVHTTKESLQCKKCDRPLGDKLNYECAKCNFNFHLRCLEI